jgi:hypothetical protein
MSVYYLSMVTNSFSSQGQIFLAVNLMENWITVLCLRKSLPRIEGLVMRQ